MRATLLTFIGLLLVVAGRGFAAEPFTAAEDCVADLVAADPARLFEAVNCTIEKAAVDGGDVLVWKLPAGRTATLSIRRDHPLFARLREFDRMQFEFRIAAGGINTLEVSALGHVTGPRRSRVHQMELAVLTTPHQTWLTREFDFNRPNWLPWTTPDGEGSDVFFRLGGMALEPGTVVEVRLLRLVRGLVELQPFFEPPIAWPVKTEGPDGATVYSTEFTVFNRAARPTTITARVHSRHEKFGVVVTPDRVDVKNGQAVKFKLSATISRQDVAATPELYEEPLRIAFASVAAPEAEAWHLGTLVRPLSPGLRTQVIARDADLAYVREKLAAGDESMKALTDVKRTLAAADEFVGIELVRIPVQPGHVGNHLYSDVAIGRSMPEIVDTTTGAREFGTNRAMQHWQGYLNYPGGTLEKLGMAYLLTGDEKYAAKGAELMALYGRQYGELPFHQSFLNVPGGPNLLCASRVSAVSTYGTNWLFKGHVRMLSAISNSRAWAAAPRAEIYEGFVLPYATELMKFYGGISNMTDVTNHNLLLLGLVFDDAGLVRFATRSDPGLLSRLRDITAEGFSSEGRPLNYHFAAMAEYLPSINYLANSGLTLDYPRDRLPAAIRMAYQRATLTGQVPSTGDCGRGMVVGQQPLADNLIDVFPDQAWLADVGGASTFAKKVLIHRSGKRPDGEAWRGQLETRPRLFPDAGMAVLRTGDTPEVQVFATLDYGRNVFHAALDRQQITLAAFGRIYSHGPGSLYNVGSGGMTRGADPALEAFIGHHSVAQNVIVVDGVDQDVAVGRLLAWSAEPGRQFAVTRVDGVRPGVSHTRALVLAKGIVVVLDRIESNEPHVYDFVYHNFGKLEPGKGWAATPAGQPLATTSVYEKIGDLRALKGAGPLRLEWDLSTQVPADDARYPHPRTPMLTLWQLPVGRAYTGVTGLNNPNTATMPDAAPSLFTRVEGQGRPVAFATVLEPHLGAGSSVPPRVAAIAGAGADITVTFSDGDTLALSLDGLAAAGTK